MLCSIGFMFTGPSWALKHLRLAWLQDVSLSNYFFGDGTYASFDRIRTYGKEKGHVDTRIPEEIGFEIIVICS